MLTVLLNPVCISNTYINELCPSFDEIDNDVHKKLSNGVSTFVRIHNSKQQLLTYLYS